MKECTKKFLELQSNPRFCYLFEIIQSYKDKVIAEYWEKDKIQLLTYSEFVAITEKIAVRLQNWVGISQQGRFIGLHLDNFALWPALFWGILKAGYNPILLDFRSSSETLNHLLQNSQAVAIITQDPSVCPSDILILKKEEMLQDLDKETIPVNGKWGTCVAFCTSGTTATSKIFVYDEYALVMNLSSGHKSYERTKTLMQPNAKILAFLPFYHIFGLLAVYLWPMLCGTTVVYLKDRAPTTFVETCQKHQITDVYAVPIVWANLANKIMAKIQEQPKWKQLMFRCLCNLSLAIQHITPYYGQRWVYHHLFAKIHKNLLGLHIKGCITGGAHISPTILKFLLSLGIPLTSGFGMTEAGAICIEETMNFSPRLKASLGSFFVGIESKIVPNESHALASKLHHSLVGEIWLRGACLHTGRLEGGKILPPMKDEQGWFATGDVGKQVHGALYLLGRCKDTIIKETGENVYPDDLEDCFRGIPSVQEFCVLGVGDTSDQEKITLVMYLGSEQPTAEMLKNMAQVIAETNNQLPIYKRLDQVFIAHNSLPTTTTLKTQRQILKKAIQEHRFQYTPLDFRNVSKIDVPTITNNITEKKNAIREEIRIIFGQVLGKPVSVISDSAHFIQDLGGDSLKAIELATALETKYNIVISDTILMQCNNIIELSEAVWQQMQNPVVQHSTPNATSSQIGLSQKTPITCIEDSREYQNFARYLQMVGDKNPYFIHHDSVVRDTSIVENREMINLASYNYLGMSGQSEVIQAVQEAVAKYGTSASGSRLLTGEKTLYRQLEQEIARWKHCEDALVLVSGHATNVTLVGNFCKENDLILYDAISHNSIEQGCRLSKSKSKAFPHNDVANLATILQQQRSYYEKVLLVVEGAYSMDGDIAPIPDIVALKKRYGTFLMVDEAHSACVLGKTGRGVDEHFGLEPEDIDIRMGTLSKGLGSCGGYIAGKKNLIEFLRYNLPGFVFSVAITPANAAAALKALEIIQRDHSMIQRLHANIDFFIKEAYSHNFDTCLAQITAIIPILVGSEDVAFTLSKKLQQHGVFVPPAIYPAVPKGKARLRFCVTSEHKPEQIRYALNTLQELAREEKIILPHRHSSYANA